MTSQSNETPPDDEIPMAATGLPPFDNRIVIESEDGGFIRFLTHPLDPRYIHEPQDDYLPGMLPPAEIELRHALNDLKFALLTAASFNAIGRRLMKKKYQSAQDRLNGIVRYLTQQLGSSPEHRAALRRILNTMPPTSSGYELLAQFLKHTVHRNRV